ncbi:hypothetical protein [Bradyrhizobium sp. URHD0069]|uniref:hypothetical protein n=1 Tax=Bradyrhizobium sp. URHD0069 TaxID=1380355 RepID=UPI0004954D37
MQLVLLMNTPALNKERSFRSAFRDWASERTNFAREICEAALAHIVKDKTEAAHRRGDLFNRRRELMVAWAAFVAAQSTVIAHVRSARFKKPNFRLRRSFLVLSVKLIAVNGATELTSKNIRVWVILSDFR